MVKTGEKLRYSPIVYPGRSPKTIHEFLEIRSDIRNMYVYDVLLSSGEMIYACAGGIGITKERYITDMHKFLSIAPSYKYISDVYFNVFNNTFSRGTYLRIRAAFNDNPSLSCWKDHAILYCLWASSSFRHKYLGRGYNARFSPREINIENIEYFSNISRNKKILFRKEDFNSLSESIIHDGVVIYAHLPNSFGKYGCDFFWNKQSEYRLLRNLTELGDMGYKFCVSADYSLKSRLDCILDSCNVYEVNQFKERRYSEIYYTNF